MAELILAASNAWLRQLVGGVGPVFVLGFLIFWVQRWTQLSWVQTIGWRGLVFWTGWIGTPIHELSHVIVGKLFGVRIEEVSLFNPDTRSGVLGYVRYRLPRLRLTELPQVIGTFFMGIAPLFGGAFALLMLRLVLLDPESNTTFFDAASAFATALPNAEIVTLGSDFIHLVAESYRPIFEGHGRNLWLWLYLYASLAVGVHLAPSGADLQGALRGLGLIGVLAFIANLAVVGAGFDATSATSTIAEITAPVCTLLTLALALNVGHGAVAFALAAVKRMITGR